MTRADLEAAVIGGMETAAETVMQWGRDDCALWVADILAPMLGYDPAAIVRGRYRTRRGSLRVTGRAGLLGQLRAIARRHKWKRIDPRQAQPGDVGLVWITSHGKPVLATVICRARGWFVGREERGVSLVRAKRVASAWSVLDDALPTESRRVSLRKWSARPGIVPTSAVTHDPISISLLTFVGIEATATAVAVTTFAITATLSIGVSLVSAALTSKPATGQSITASGDSGSIGNIADTSPLQGAQVTERQPIPFQRVIVGSAYVGGALFFEQKHPPYLTMGVLINFGQISGIERAFIGTDELSFTSITPNTILTPIAITGQPDYPGHLRVCFRYGTSAQATDPLILARFPNVGTEFRQRGTATGVYEFHYGGTDNSAATQAAFTALWGNVARPNMYTICRGVFAYDPRDATQSLTDPTTWKWTNNATLIQTWYLIQDFGGRIPTSKIRWDKTIISANYDDDLIGCNDGTMIRRHTIDGVITLSQQPYNVMQDLLPSNRAALLESGGMVWIESSRPKTPVATIHDRILAGGITYQGAKQKSDKINRLQCRFVSPDQEYQLVDGPVLDRTDYQAIDGEPLIATLALNYVTDYRRAERLQKAFMLTSRLGGSITCTVDIRFLAIVSANTRDELIGQVVTVDSQLFSRMNGTYMVMNVGFADDCTTLALSLTRYDSSIETTWNPETDEAPFTLATINTA